MNSEEMIKKMEENKRRLCRLYAMKHNDILFRENVSEQIKILNETIDAAKQNNKKTENYIKEVMKL